MCIQAKYLGRTFWFDHIGPDLTHEGGKRSNDWHVAHFWNPEHTTPDSVMPRFTWFFRDGWQVRRRIDPETAERTFGLSPDTSYPVPGVYETEADAKKALERIKSELPASLEAEGAQLFVAEGRGLNRDGLTMLAYLQWLGTWEPPVETAEVDK